MPRSQGKRQGTASAILTESKAIFQDLRESIRGLIDGVMDSEFERLKVGY